MQTNLLERVLKTIKNYEMLGPGDIVLAAVSGGPDSVFLAHALNILKKKLKLKRIILCNLDHGLRPRQSREDSLFTKRLAAELRFEYAHKKVDVNKLRSKELSIEEAARRARYGFFASAAVKTGANVVATGHTLDDQAETVLMRVMKGSSLKGIIGISPVRQGGAIRIVRPLLEIEKKLISDWLDRKGIAYRIDRTNLEPVYFRNIIRHEVMPFLERYNPRLKRALSNIAEHLREDFEFINAEKERVKSAVLGKNGRKPEIALKDIAVQPRAIQKEIIRDMLGSSGGLVKKLSFRHWKEIEHLIRHKGKNSSIDLPGSVRVTKTARMLIFRKV